MAVISVVVPVYYNAPSLPSLAERLAIVADNNARHEFEFIYVDDGSNDDSYVVLKRLAARDRRIRIVKLARNFGSNTAILAGMTYASGDCVGFIAADLQDPPEKLTEMVAHWEAGNRVILAVRKDRRGDPWSTRLFSNLFNWLFKKLVFDDFSPQGVGFFLVDRKVVDMLLRCEEKNPHLIGLILWSGYQRQTVEYDRLPRAHGTSRWTLGKKLKYFVDAFTAFSYLPLRLASAMGLLLAGLGGLYALVVVASRFLSKVPVPGWTALMVVVLLTSGTQLLILGIIGEYLWRNLDATRRRPLFTVESTVNLSDRGPHLPQGIPGGEPTSAGRECQ
jgi:dolichol-phosphate mannosyltransferase